MKRFQERDSPLKSKRSRSSVPRSDDSFRDRISPERDRRDGRNKSPSYVKTSHRSPHGVKPRESERSGRFFHEGGHEGRGDNGRGRSLERAPPYKVICVSNINSKVSDGTVRDALMLEFKKFDAVDVRIVHDDNERLAFVHFRNPEDAREARHAKGRLILFDKLVVLEPAYSNSSRKEGEPRSRRNYEEPFPPRPRFSSPTHSNSSGNSMGRRPRHGSMEQHFPHHPPPIHHHRDIPPPYRKDYGPPPDFRQPQMPFIREEKKFPNYLHHIAPEDDEKATRTLFVGNLEVGIQDTEVRQIFEAYGVVDDVDVKRPPPDQGNAYAFVKFMNLDMAHRAKVAMSGQYIGKFQCKIGYGKASPSTKIWVGGLGPWTSLSHLEKEFDRFGAIKKIEFAKGDDYAYILYDSLDAAQAACQEMRGFPLGGPDRRLRLDFAESGAASFSHFVPQGSQQPFDGPPRQDQPFYSGGRGHDFHKKWQNHGGRFGHYGRGHYHSKPHGDWSEHREQELVPQNQYWKGDRENWHPEGGREWQNRNTLHSPEMHANGGAFKQRRPPSPDAPSRHRPFSPKRERPYGSVEREGSPSRDRRYSGKRDDFDSPPRNGSATQRATTMQDLIKCCPVLWHGGLVLKSLQNTVSNFDFW